MRRLILSALALALAGPAWAGSSDEYACMRDGPGSRACEWSQFQNERQNDERAERARRAAEAQHWNRN